MSEDIEVARYGLRTFGVKSSGLHSLFKESIWHDGKAVASCEYQPPVVTFPGLLTRHDVPHEHCSCGLYATVDLQSLVRQYPTQLELVDVITTCWTTGLDTNTCWCVDCTNRRKAAVMPYASHIVSRPAIAHTLSYNPLQQPVPTPKPEPTTTEIEVGRHALRSFKYANGKLMSLYKDFSWDGGVAVAKCMATHPCDECPSFDCNCGLFGSVTITHLMTNYKEHAVKGIAVIAAEGMTLIGDTGLRTSAARIVAYWADEEHKVDFATNCPEAKAYAELNCMLADYKFEEWVGEFPPPKIRYDAPQATNPSFPATKGYPQQSYALGNYDLTIKPLVATTATAGGIAALKLLMDGKIG